MGHELDGIQWGHITGGHQSRNGPYVAKRDMILASMQTGYKLDVVYDAREVSLAPDMKRALKGQNGQIQLRDTTNCAMRVSNARADIFRIVRELRERTGLTQEKLAAKLGVIFSTINRWENGLSKPSRLARAQLDAFCKRMQAAGMRNLPEAGRG